MDEKNAKKLVKDNANKTFVITDIDGNVNKQVLKIDKKGKIYFEVTSRKLKKIVFRLYLNIKDCDIRLAS